MSSAAVAAVHRAPQSSFAVVDLLMPVDRMAFAAAASSSSSRVRADMALRLSFVFDHLMHRLRGARSGNARLAAAFDCHSIILGKRFVVVVAVAAALVAFGPLGRSYH